MLISTVRLAQKFPYIFVRISPLVFVAITAEKSDLLHNVKEENQKEEAIWHRKITT